MVFNIYISKEYILGHSKVISLTSLPNKKTNMKLQYIEHKYKESKTTI